MQHGSERSTARLHDIRLERARQQGDDKGHRVLVDRIWPRGVKKAELRFDARCPEIAPSPALRRWFGHDPEKWQAFRARYAGELDDRPEVVAELQAIRREQPLVLVYDARDPEHNHAAALRDYLCDREGPG